MTEIKINERWGFTKDQYQTILHEHFMGPGGRNPRTGEEVPPKMVERRTFHPTLKAAVLAAIEKDVDSALDLGGILHVTRQWHEIADRIAGELNPAAE